MCAPLSVCTTNATLADMHDPVISGRNLDDGSGAAPTTADDAIDGEATGRSPARRRGDEAPDFTRWSGERSPTGSG